MPKSYTLSISVVFKVILPIFSLVLDLSISIVTTSPSIISASSFILIPILLLKACVKLSVLLISKENISEPDIIVKGVSLPNDLAKPKAKAVFPVPGCPPINTALPAIFPSYIILKTIPIALRAFFYPTNPYATFLGSKASFKPSPLICECASTLSNLLTSFTCSIFGSIC